MFMWSLLKDKIQLYFIIQQWSVQISWYANNYPTRCNYIQFIYICKLLCTFRVVSPPIIRSSCHRIHSILLAVPIQSRSRKVAVTVLLMPDAMDTVTWAPDDEWRYHMKHAEQFTDINKLYIVASRWMIIGIYSRCMDPWTLNAN
jgi:hypothetical protein